VHIHASTRSALIALAAAATFTFTLVYGPVKVLYATGGAIVSGFAWVFSAGDTDVAKPIWDASMRGDYMIVPDQLRGREQLEFIGRSPEQIRAMETPLQEEPNDEGF
jgi:hypothetical protein